MGSLRAGLVTAFDKVRKTALDKVKYGSDDGIVAANGKHIYKHEETTLTKVTIRSKRMKVFKEADKNERFEMRHVWGFVVSPGTTATG